MKSIWTRSGARLQCVRSEGEKNWIFLPGGPGLGSESLAGLTGILPLDGTVWLLDLPGDGSNATKGSFHEWQRALIEAASELKHVIMVAHSTGGMYVLSSPKIESRLDGLVLLDTAPDTSWQAAFANIVKGKLDVLEAEYRKNPTNETLKALTVAAAPFLFTEKGMAKGIELLESLPYNTAAHQWSEKHFDATYRAKWVPQTIPTLILSGDHDLLTPLTVFTTAKQFHRPNITLREIKNAGHFPWIDNPDEVVAAFKEFIV